jgi:hypothetical protein
VGWTAVNSADRHTSHVLRPTVNPPNGASGVGLVPIAMVGACFQRVPAPLNTLQEARCWIDVEDVLYGCLKLRHLTQQDGVVTGIGFETAHRDIKCHEFRGHLGGRVPLRQTGGSNVMLPVARPLIPMRIAQMFSNSAPGAGGIGGGAPGAGRAHSMVDGLICGPSRPSGRASTIANESRSCCSMWPTSFRRSANRARHISGHWSRVEPAGGLAMMS